MPHFGIAAHGPSYQAHGRYRGTPRAGRPRPFSVAPFPLPAGDDLAFLLEQRLAEPGARKTSATTRGPAGWRASCTATRTGPPTANDLRRFLAHDDDLVGERLPALRRPLAARPRQLSAGGGGDAQLRRSTTTTCCTSTRSRAARPTAPASSASSRTSTPASRDCGSPASRSPGCSTSSARDVGLPAAGGPGVLTQLRHGLLRMLSRPDRAPRSAYERVHAPPAQLPQGERRLAKALSQKAMELRPRLRLARDHRHRQPRRPPRPVRPRTLVLPRPESLALPDESPPALLRRACGFEVLRRAA